jgi:hypothetical protein
MADGDWWRASDTMRAEWEAWQQVNAECKRLGIDMNAEKYHRLIKAICLWGEYLAWLRCEQTEQQRRAARNSYLAAYDDAKRLNP